MFRDGFVPDGGTLWLAAFAVVATAGALMLFTTERPCQHRLRALGLGLTAFSPTTFAHVLNLVVLVLAVTELALAIASKRRPRQLSATG